MKRVAVLAMLAGCPDSTSNPAQLWLGGDPANELITYLVDNEPEPF